MRPSENPVFVNCQKSNNALNEKYVHKCESANSSDGNRRTFASCRFCEHNKRLFWSVARDIIPFRDYVASRSVEGWKLDPYLVNVCPGMSDLFIANSQVSSIVYKKRRCWSYFYFTTLGDEAMIKARQPCRQLNSQTIIGNALCFVGPVVAGKCSIISAKCVCEVKEKALRKSWDSICKTRDTCDRAIAGGCG